MPRNLEVTSAHQIAAKTKAISSILSVQYFSLAHCLPKNETRKNNYKHNWNSSIITDVPINTM